MKMVTLSANKTQGHLHQQLPKLIVHLRLEDRNQCLFIAIPVSLKGDNQSVNMSRPKSDCLIQTFVSRKTSGKIVCLTNI